MSSTSTSLVRVEAVRHLAHAGEPQPVVTADPRQKSERRQRTHLVGVRLLPAEHETLNWAAAERGISVSSLLRTSALSAVMCGAIHPLDDSVLCKVVGPHELHDYDGLGDWAAEPETETADGP